MAHAHNPIPACRRLADPAKRRTCLRRARRHNRTHRCRPRPPAEICARVGRCDGVAVNNCGKLINCTCPAGKTCLGNSGCSRVCAVFGDPGDCPAGCTCGASLDNGQGQCLPTTITECDQVPQACTNSAQCPLGQFCGTTGCPGSASRCIPVCLV